MCFPDFQIEGDDLKTIETQLNVLGQKNDDIADDPNESWSVISLLKGLLSVLMSLFEFFISTQQGQAQTTGIATSATIPFSKALTVYALTGNIEVYESGNIVAVIPEGGTFTFDRRRWLQYPEYQVTGGSFIVNYFIN